MHTKWRLIHLETPVKLSVSLFKRCSKSVCNNGSSMSNYRADWFVNHSLQSHQFVGRPVEEEEREEKEEEKIEVSVYNCSGLF